MGRIVFILSDFVLAFFLFFGGLNLALPHGDFHLVTFAPGVGLAVLGVLVFAFAPRAVAGERWLYGSRILVYCALFVVLTGAFIQHWIEMSATVPKADWYLVAIGGTFLGCNAVGYAAWGWQKTNWKKPEV